VPVIGIPQALEVRSRRADILLGGERDGLRISAELTGTIAFDLGNSPREFTAERVGGRTIAMTTTNGTRALRACAHAREILVACFLNLQAVCGYLAEDMPSSLVLVCSGTKEGSAYEDVLGAGALAASLADSGNNPPEFSDSAIMAQRLYDDEKDDLLAAVSRSQNGRRLLSHPELKEDVNFCVQRNLFGVVPVMTRSGEVVLPVKAHPKSRLTAETTTS
jgi:2-phosphosulfolactate phosphatase